MSQRTLQKHISRLMALLLCALLLVTCIPVARANGESGSCGDSLSWILTDGTLTISGSGAMWNFSESTMAPWYSLREEVRRLSLPEGLTHVGDLAFYDCNRLTSVSLPASVRSIGKFAFSSSENIRVLDLEEGLQTIEEDAFHGCWELKQLSLPQSLHTIGEKAFYDCSSLTSVIIPSGVRSLGPAAFAYCTSLVRAEVQTRLAVLPVWTFFGCSQLSTLILPDSITQMGNAALRNCYDLNTVSYGGDSVSIGQLQEMIAEDVPGFGSTGFVTNEVPGIASISGTATENPDGSVSEQITTAVTGENSSVSSTIDRTMQEDSDDSVIADITVTIENDDGWEEALENVESALDSVADRAQSGTTVGTSNVTVYVKDSDTVSDKFLEPLAGRDVIVTVVTKDGSAWKIDCSTLVNKEMSGAYNLRFSLEPADAEALERMGANQGYRIRFYEDATINAEVMVLLPDETIRQVATLFKEEKNSLEQYQSTLVDGDGYVHLHLASVESGCNYYIGINVEAAIKSVVIPDTLQEEYAAPDYIEPIKYEITGRKSSWNMGLGKVMAILAAVMVSAVAVVGAVMFFWNKQRLKNGYVPNWDDDEA